MSIAKGDADIMIRSLICPNHALPSRIPDMNSIDARDNKTQNQIGIPEMPTLFHSTTLNQYVYRVQEVRLFDNTGLILVPTAIKMLAQDCNIKMWYRYLLPTRQPRL